MHSRIYQIGLEPIARKDFVSPMAFYENCSEFADYIGDEYGEKDRLEAIEQLAESFHGLLDYVGNGTLRYNGMGMFMQEWTNEFKQLANEITAENFTKGIYQSRLLSMLRKTHRFIDSRFYIEDWNGYPGPANDLIEVLERQKEGSRLYVGAVIDFHF